MAKQTFTTGQVLTAAQMTSLQQTAMLGGSASAKVASYTLVAADAGTTVSMSNAGATTITVNTGLFAAGDTVTILNVGAGTCTITAGTATVSKPTNATLALVTSAGGVLYFTATGAATFLPFDVGSGSTSPLTTKGDLFGYDTANARIPIGTNDTVLTADSTQALGLKWAAVSGAAYTLLSTTTLSSATTTVSSINSTYKHLMINAKIKPNASGNKTAFQVNGGGLPFIQQLSNEGTPTSVTNFSDNTTKVNLYGNADHDPAWGDGFLNLMIYNYANNVNSSAKFKTMFFQSIASNASGNAIYSQGTAFYIVNSNAISSFSLLTSGTAFTSGEIKVYGVN